MSDQTVTRSSGNVFADIGLPNPEDVLRKAKVIAKVRTVIDARKLSQTAAAELVGLRQPDLSKLLAGRSAGFSLERLLEIVAALGNDVEISIRKAEGDAGRIVISEAA